MGSFIRIVVYNAHNKEHEMCENDKNSINVIFLY